MHIADINSSWNLKEFYQKIGQVEMLDYIKYVCDLSRNLGLIWDAQRSRIETVPRASDQIYLYGDVYAKQSLLKRSDYVKLLRISCILQGARICLKGPNITGYAAMRQSVQFP